MIKINLLPTKRKPPRKVTELQKQLIIGVVVLAGVAGAMAFYFLHLNGKISARTKQRQLAQARVAEQDNMLREVKNVEEERKKVKEKIDIIEQLKKNQQGPVRLLDELSRALPANVDFKALEESKGTIKITGEAFSNEDVVKLVDNLKTSPYLTGINLLETRLEVVDGFEIYKYQIELKYKGI